MSNNNFFSKANVYPTIWAIIVSAIAFIGGLIWNSWSGPNEVYVTNNTTSKDTTVTIISFKPDEEYFNKINNLTKKSIQQEFSKPNEKKNTIDSLSLKIAKEYQSKFDSLLIATNNIESPNVQDKIVSQSLNNKTPKASQIKRPKYKIPSVVQGYTQGKINSFASTSINGTTFNREEKVNLSIDFFNKSTLEKITPIFVSIVEQKSEHSLYHIWGEQYEINETKNIISFSPDFKPGKYTLTLGFYLISELNTKFPALYLKKYYITVK